MRSANRPAPAPTPAEALADRGAPLEGAKPGRFELGAGGAAFGAVRTTSGPRVAHTGADVRLRCAERIVPSPSRSVELLGGGVAPPRTRTIGRRCTMPTGAGGVPFDRTAGSSARFAELVARPDANCSGGFATLPRSAPTASRSP